MAEQVKVLNSAEVDELVPDYQDPSFDWVSARAACSIKEGYERLLAGVRRDIEVRGKQVTDGTKFGLTEYQGQFAVFREGGSLPPFTVRFVLEGQQIHVSSDSGDLECHVTVGLNGFGDCRFYVGEEQQVLDWHLRAHVLKRLLFGY